MSLQTSHIDFGSVLLFVLFKNDLPYIYLYKYLHSSFFIYIFFQVGILNLLLRLRNAQPCFWILLAISLRALFLSP